MLVMGDSDLPLSYGAQAGELAEGLYEKRALSHSHKKVLTNLKIPKTSSFEVPRFALTKRQKKCALLYLFPPGKTAILKNVMNSMLTGTLCRIRPPL